MIVKLFFYLKRIEEYENRREPRRLCWHCAKRIFLPLVAIVTNMRWLFNFNIYSREQYVQIILLLGNFKRMALTGNDNLKHHLPIHAKEKPYVLKSIPELLRITCRLMCNS
ncbi:hypothetical protein TNCT_565491 [Trichonephila clavata]|uniref:Uncharacterized protein n=1 Tax=Trichonephila clavata TaxID=2740835 RepID=A0A8X6LHY2_TRICU|nr:hypothetical protein TNCT_565491 [Trichonephila clavata]